MADVGALLQDAMKSGPANIAPQAPQLSPEQISSAILKDKSATALKRSMSKNESIKTQTPHAQMSPFEKYIQRGVGDVLAFRHGVQNFANGIEQPIRYGWGKLTGNLKGYENWNQHVALQNKNYSNMESQIPGAHVADMVGNAAPYVVLGGPLDGLVKGALSKTPYVGDAIAGLMGGGKVAQTTAQAIRSGIGGALVGASMYGSPTERAQNAELGLGLGAAMPFAGEGAKQGWNSIKGIGKSAVDAVKPFTDAGRKQIVGKFLRKTANNQPFNIPDNAPMNVKTTLGDATGNQGILNLQKSRMAKRPEFGTRMNDVRNLNQQKIAQSVSELGGSVSPDAFMSHVQNRHEQLQNSIDALRQTAQGATESSQSAMNAVRQAYNSTKQQERSLWNEVRINGEPAQIPVGPIAADVNRLVGTTPKANISDLPQEAIGPLNALNKTDKSAPSLIIGANGEPVVPSSTIQANAPLNEIQAVRSKALDLARSAKVAGEGNKARLAGNVADIIGQHLDNLQFQNPELANSYRTAKNFTRQLHQTFDTHPSIERLTRINSAGAPVIQPSEALNGILKNPEGVQAYRAATGGSQEAEQALHDHLVSKGSMQSNIPAWIDRNKGVLDQVPSAQKQLGQIARQQNALKQLERSKAGLILNRDPSSVIDSVVFGPNPVTGMKGLLDSTGTNATARQGLKRLVADRLVSKMMLANDDLSYTQAKKAVPALRQLFTAPHEQKLIKELPDAIKTINATRNSTFTGGSHTAELHNGNQAQRSILLKLAGGKIGGIFHFIPGINIYSGPQDAIESLIDEALINPQLGRSLVAKATPQNERRLVAEMQKGWVGKGLSKWEKHPLPKALAPFPGAVPNKAALSPAVPTALVGSHRR